MTDAPEHLARGIDQIIYNGVFQATLTSEERAVVDITYDSAYHAAESEIGRIYKEY